MFYPFCSFKYFSFQAVSADKLLEHETQQEFLEYSDSSKSYLSPDLSKIVEDIRNSLLEGNQKKLEETLRNIDIKSHSNLFSRLR